MTHRSTILSHGATLPTLPELPPGPPIGVRLRHCVAGRTMARPLLIERRAPLVLPAGHQLEMVRPDAGSQPAGVIRLVPGRDPPAVEDLPRDVMAAADLLA